MSELNIVQLTKWIETKQKKESDADRAKRIVSDEVLKFLKNYSEAECTSAEGAYLAGEVYALYGRAGTAVQVEFISKLCKAEGIALPGATLTARQQLVHAVYGKHPRLAEVAKGQKDSLGGKRISWAIAMYNASITGKKRIRKPVSDAVRERARALRVILRMYEVATPAQKKMLDDLSAKCFGIKQITAQAEAA